VFDHLYVTDGVSVRTKSLTNRTTVLCARCAPQTAWVFAYEVKDHVVGGRKKCEVHQRGIASVGELPGPKTLPGDGGAVRPPPSVDNSDLEQMVDLGLRDAPIEKYVGGV
jgi:hypothetical protein